MLRIAPLLATALLPAVLTAQTPTESGAYLMRVGKDTLVLERFGQTGNAHTGSISIKGQPRLDYRFDQGADGLIPSVGVSVFPLNAPAGTPAIRDVKVTMQGDSAWVEVDGSRRGYPMAPHALPLLNNSFAVVELYTIRARQKGDSVDIPVWSMAGGANLVVSVRAVGADSMTISVAGQQSRVRVDRVGRILGGVIPAQRLMVERLSEQEAQAIHFDLPDYSAPAGAPYTATEVTLQGPGSVRLGGTLTMPTGVKGPVPAIVTITGSGQQDRDEYIPVAGGYRLFRQVADTLGRRGIAVLRLDDRMVGLSSGPLGTSADYADDIRAALAWLRTQPGIDPERLGLVGHSEGGMIAPMVASTDSSLRGIVLLAGTGEPGSEILRYQQKEAIDGDANIAMTARDSMYRVAAAATDTAARTNPWLAYFMQHDPIAVAKRVARTPVLILQGANDHQVKPEQAAALSAAFTAAGNSDVTVHLFPGLNHFFLPDPNGSPSGYARLTDNHIPGSVMGTMADWLVTRLSR